MPATRFLLLFVLLLSGCATQVDRLDARLGLVPPPQGDTGAAETRALMQSHFDAGLAALKQNDLDGAVAAWRRHVQLAPQASPQVRDVRGYLTLLERERGKRYALQAAAREGQWTPGDRLRVALLPFHLENEAPGNTRPFNRAILAMVSSDLARVPAIQLLERRRIDAVFQELKLSESGLLDPASALRGGRILGAGSVVAGTVYNGAPPHQVYTGEGRYTLSVSVSDVARGSLLGVQEAYGQQRNFFELEKQIVHGILDILGVKERPAEVDRIHTRNWDAYAQFTLGLKHLAEDQFEAARAAFAQALRFDPNFQLAEEYHLDTPERSLTLEEIRARAERR